ncbi:Arm DNA-binding domain-containing protein [Bordetella hinzii]|uniref:Arm DNA-binding domain-containing protein n=1 Tax=Bordetella hinzii TaxID=103855 RepID=UPI0039FDCA79
MPENLLTDLKIKSIKPAERDYKLSDGGGLFLLVKPTGGKLWRWKYRIDGKENLFAIGAFPKISLAQARAARDTARSLIKQDIHPSHERQSVKRRNLGKLRPVRPSARPERNSQRHHRQAAPRAPPLGRRHRRAPDRSPCKRRPPAPAPGRTIPLWAPRALALLVLAGAYTFFEVKLSRSTDQVLYSLDSVLTP